MKKIAFLVVLVVGVSILGVAIVKLFGPSRTSSEDRKWSTQYSTGNAGYQCSKPIELKKQEVLVHHMRGQSWETLYLPVDESKAKLLCHGTWME